jgi:hypothetical protein
MDGLGPKFHDHLCGFLSGSGESAETVANAVDSCQTCRHRRLLPDKGAVLRERSDPMSIGIWIAIAVIATAIVSITITLRIVRHQQSQSAKGGGNIQAQAGRDIIGHHAGRDVLAIEHSESTAIVASSAFFGEGEQLATSESEEEFRSQVASLWSAASRYVHGVSLYGRPFMPDISQLRTLLERGVQLEMTLVDPRSDAAAEIAQDKCRFSRTIDHYRVLAQTLRIEDLEPRIVLERIRSEVDATVEIFAKLAREFPAADLDLRFIDFLPVWKGTIIDGERAVYLLYDVPRMDVPFRYSDDQVRIAWYERHYVRPFKAAGRPIGLTETAG